MARCVFFADLLGFRGLSVRDDGEAAADALSDVALVLSERDEVARYLQASVWSRRYGLSDSLFLVGEDPVAACSAAAELFFNLAYVNCRAERPVLMRGGLAYGRVREVEPIFPETGKGNVVGAAVVEAVDLEKRPEKGPRLFVQGDLVALLQAKGASVSWALEPVEDGVAEVLWLLSPDPTATNPSMVGDVCRKAVELFEQHAVHPRFGRHYVGYLELCVRSLARLRSRDPEGARATAERGGLSRVEETDLLSQDLRSRLQEILRGGAR